METKKEGVWGQNSKEAEEAGRSTTRKKGRNCQKVGKSATLPEGETERYQL